jgi:hypothetical protein
MVILSVGRHNVGSSRYLGITNGGGGFGDSSGGHIEFTSNASTNGINFYTYNGGATYGIKMAITSGGNVLIGTTTDNGARLQVSGEGKFYQPLTNTTSYLTVENNRARNAAIRLKTTVGDYYLGTGIGADVNQFQIYDGTSGVNRLVISSTGAATFGSSVTANGMTLLNSGGTYLNYYVSTYLIGRIGNVDTNDMYYDSTFGGNHYFRTGTGGTTNPTTKFTIASSGNVLIGTTTDSGYKLDVQQGATNAAKFNFAVTGAWGGGANQDHGMLISGARYSSDTNTSLLHIINTDNTSLFRVTDYGKVGIGTDSPSSTLDVRGSTSITGNLEILAGGVGSGFNRQISIGSGTAYNYQLKADGDDFNIIEAGSTSRLRYDYGDVRWYITGGLTISGSLSKGSGSFKIDHPLPEKKDTHHLVHSFVEAPQADNIYRGKIDLVDGFGEVNIDEASGMSEGTFVLLNGNIQCFTSNEKGWTAIRGKVEGNILKIEAQDLKCNDTISWLVIGERIDQHMIDTDWTDENGKVIVEPLKKINK